MNTPLIIPDLSELSIAERIQWSSAKSRERRLKGSDTDLREKGPDRKV